MITAEQLRKEFTNYLTEKDMRYTVMDEEDNMVYLAFGGNTETFVMVDFDENDGEDADSVNFSSQGFATVNQSNTPAALIKLNEINGRFRWAKFYLHDGKICANSDAKIYPGTVGQECRELTISMSNIIEQVVAELEGIAEVDEDQKRMLDMLAIMKCIEDKER